MAGIFVALLYGAVPISALLLSWRAVVKDYKEQPNVDRERGGL